VQSRGTGGNCGILASISRSKHLDGGPVLPLLLLSLRPALCSIASRCCVALCGVLELLPFTLTLSCPVKWTTFLFFQFGVQL